MAQIDFRTQQLAQLYVNGGVGGNEYHFNYWRDQNGLSGELKDDILSLDNRIANFQNIITDGVKPGNEDTPYDAALLKREFMEEVFGLMMKRAEYHGTINNISFPGFPNPISQSIGQNGLLNPNQFKNPSGEIIWDGRNFSNMSLTAMRNCLNATPGNGALPVWDAYSALIDGVLAEGNKLKNNPIDLSTGTTIVTKSVTAITERTIGGITYDRVSFDGQRHYLISKGAQVYTAEKTGVGSFRANVGGSITQGATIDSVVSLTPGTMTNATYLEVNADLVPVTGTTIVAAQRNLSPVWYIYYWNEARVKILRAQLAQKEAVTSEIRDDLAKANRAFADLEKQAAGTRAQSADGKTQNPDTTPETLFMNVFYATNAKSGTSLVDKAGTDTLHNYGDWQSNRSLLKTYIDRKSTQSQDAMLDYQTTLNRYNNAFEVMSKLQEKFDGLVKSQLRNVA